MACGFDQLSSAEVVKYSGTLHSRSYPWMREDAETADLCLVLGTSLGGLNADQDGPFERCGPECFVPLISVRPPRNLRNVASRETSDRQRS